MEEKRRLLIALGSNFNQQSNMNKAEGLLRHFFGGIVFTPTVWTDPIDNPLPDKYLNRLATTMTHQSLAAVERILKEIERECGRMEVDSKQGAVSMDIDILLYGDTRYHECDWQRPYIHTLLALLKEEQAHPHD